MARLAPEEGYELLKDRVTEAVQDIFPIEGKKHTLRVKNVAVLDNKDTEDLRSQKKAKMDGRTWAVPVEADLELLDSASGKVIDSRKQRIAHLPKVTNRHSYIVDGNEYQLDNLWKLRPGAYSRVNQRGEFETMFNLKGRSKFDVNFDPKTAKFVMKKGGSQIPLYPMLREMGISDEQLEKTWGKQVLAANRVKDTGPALTQFHRVVTKAKPESREQARQFLHEFMDGAEMDPEVSQITLGAPHKTVTGDSIMSASNKLLGISRGETKPDARDSLMFKTLHSAEDHLTENMRQRSRDVVRRVNNNLNRKSKIQDIIGPDVLNRPLKEVFTKTSLGNTPDQTNPLEMMSGAMKTTIMGDLGGITSEHKITQEAKLIDPSHLGYLDPIHTPEGSKTGVTLHLPLGATKKGNKVAVKMWNTKTEKMEDVDPAKAYHSNIALPDQVQWKDGKPVPRSKTIKLSGPENDIVEGSLKDADYVMAAPAQMFSVASNMIPFMQNTSANRSTMAGRHMEQAIPLKHREKPLVETSISEGRKKETSLGKFMGQVSSQQAPVSGEVVKVSKDGVTIKDADGKKKEVQIYDHFPLNDDKGFIHSTPTVKVGDKVKAGQNVADTNFTKDGELALGTNLRAAYMPFRGYNFEDGVVVSESAAQKLTSEHMHRKGVDLTGEHTLSKKKFLAEFGQEMTKDQAEKLDDDGVVKPGLAVKPGDTLVAALRTREHTDETRMMAKMHKSLVRPHDDVSVKWEADHPGVVTNVVKRGSRAEVHVKTEEPAEIGDKLAGRHGNKGIITKIIPDHEMPQTKDGKSTEILLNPAGIPGRLNLGQVLETAAGKIAEKTGKRYRTQNFDGAKDQTDKVKKEMKAAGVEDKEEVIDPVTKKSVGKVLVGPHYIHKLKHQVDKKLIARAGGPGYAYDINRIPKGGGPHGAQALDTLGTYAMLAHGSKSNIRDMQTYKSNAENNDELWSAVQSGDLLPPPRPTFAYKKFVGMLKAIGVNTVKDGSRISLQPLTDKEVIDMSSGEIKDGGRMIKSKDLAEEKNGLFDKKLTGGLAGNKWSHITLPEAMPNPIFEKAISSLTGIKEKDLARLMSGERGYDTKTGKLVAPEEGIPGNKAVAKLLGKIDVKKDLAAAEERLKDPKLKGVNLNAAHRKVKFLRALDKVGISPDDAYMQKRVAVMPPTMRPLSASPSGTLIVDDANGTYKGLALASDQLRDAPKALPDDMKNEQRAAVYDAMKAISGMGTQPKQEYRGILDVIRGKTVKEGVKQGSPREGFFQSKLIKRKQDLSMRSTIIPEPELGLDQVGIPRKAAMELYKPFVVKELRGFARMSPLQAQKAIKDNDPLAGRALERVVEQRPVLLKRDPVLHKYGIQAFKPMLTGGKAVKIHPLVTSGYNADFDGDTMSAFVPLSNEAVDEAYNMMPSRNLFSPVTGKVMYAPTYESQLGLHTLTQIGKSSDKTFKTIAEAAKAASTGKVGMTDIVTVGKQKTSVGRALVANVLPRQLRQGVMSGKIELDGKGQKALLAQVAKDHKKEYGQVVNKLKDLGNQYATYAPVSIGLDDIKADKKIRDRILSVADRKVSEIMKGRGKLEDKRKRAVQVYDKASESMIGAIERSKDEDRGALMQMMKAGVKPNMDSYRQIKMAPMLMMNAKGEVIPTPVRRSYSEGLDVGDYWTQMSGARKGVVQKVQSVQEPGYLTKQVMNSVMSNSIGTPDCNTAKGISLPIDEKDVLDRYLAADTKAGKHTFKAGTVVTPGVRDSLRNNKVGRVVVRSPLRCEHGTGICSKCYGLDEEGKDPPVGLNVGVISGQAIGERATQLAMRTFHSGGIAPVGKKGKEQARLTDDFKRVQQLVQMYQKVPGSATLSTASGKVERIKKNPVGGMDVFVGGKKHYVPQNRGEPITFVGGKPRRLKAGMPIQKGTPISAGPVNPHEMLPLAGINKVQGYMAGQLYDLYKGEGIRRRNVETVVKSLSNLTRVRDPGDHSEFVRNDYAPTSYVQATNKKLSAKGKKPIRHAPVLKGVKTLPLDVQTDWLARLNHEKQTETIVDAASQGWASDIHGPHPIPGIVHGTEFGRAKPPKY